MNSCKYRIRFDALAIRKILPLAFLFVAFNTGFAGELKVDQSKPNLVKFVSKGPLGMFEGVTDKIDGFVSWAGDSTLVDSKLFFEVDLSSLDTRIALRNRHMREKHLETDKYPHAQYSGRLVNVEETGPNELLVAAEGMMKIHGVERDLAMEAKVTVDGDVYHLQCNFDVKLSDFEIKTPKFMFLKVDENIKLVLDFYLRTAEDDESMLKR
ncbi:MAG: YceI family protein [bacterium]